MPKGGGAQGAFESTLTGKAALFVAPLFMASVDGCRSHEEASALVAGLFQRRVAGAYQHKFGVGDLVKWFARHLLHHLWQRKAASLLALCREALVQHATIIKEADHGIIAICDMISVRLAAPLGAPSLSLTESGEPCAQALFSLVHTIWLRRHSPAALPWTAE